MERTVHRTWKPMVAGILSIIVGSLDLLGVFGVIIAAIAINTTSYWRGLIESEVYPLTIGFVVGGLLSLLGGISAIQRKRWGLALAGSIAAIFSSSILGILSLIFTAMSKDEFA
jgi:hypothetical protein